MTVASNTPYNQYTATNGQTVFNYTFEIVEQTDLLVYQTPDGDDPDDATQLLTLNVDYTVTGAGNENGGTVVLGTGAGLNDIVTIKQGVPVERDTSFTPGGVLRAADLNTEFDNQTLIQQVSRFNEDSRMLSYQNTDIVTPIVDTIIPVLGANQIWAMNNDGDKIIAYDVPSSGGLAPKVATYLLQTANADLPNAQAMGALASGFVVNTITTGVQLTRILTGTSNQITVANGSGIGGNPTLAIAANPTLPGVEYFIPPKGDTAQRPGSPTDGMVRYNTDLSALEVFEGSIWEPLSGGIVDSILGTTNQITIDNTDPVNPIVSISNNPVIPGTAGITLPTGTTAQRGGILGTIRFNSQTSEFEGTTDGIAWNTFQTSAGTVLSVSGTANQIDVTPGVNPVVSLSNTMNAPGTFNIQSTTAINAIINDSTLATATTSNIATASALKTYIDNLVTGLNIQGSCVCGSTTALTATYANGSSGVGATLTNAGAFAAISLDGVSPTVGQRVLIKNQASSLQNGIYTVTTVGDGVSVNWVLTRATDYDTPSEIQKGDLVVLTGGTTQTNSSWLETATVAAVGTDPITFVQFTASLPVNVASGGTGVTSFTAYGIIAGGLTSTGSLQQIGIGSLGQLLQSQGAGALAAYTTTTYPATNAINTIMYASSANVLGVVTPTNNGVLVYSAGGVPSSSTTLPSGLTIPGYQATITPAALTKVDDTNVTMTLGGTPSTALLQAASMTLGWTGTLAVARGGSGRGTATAYAVLCGGTTSTGAHQSVASVGTAGQVLTSNGAGALPTFQDASSAGGGLISVNTYTASDTWSRPSGCTKVFVEVVGGGGAGGAATTDNTIGTGGAGGGFGQKTIDVTAISSVTVTVGAGGTGGSGAGGNGGTSSFGAHVSCTGGTGGFANGSTSINAPGSASGGDVNAAGYFAHNSGTTSNTTNYGSSGYGANSYYGSGGRRGVAGESGQPASGYGAGGGAGYRDSSTTRNGGNGGGGLVRVWNYY